MVKNKLIQEPKQLVGRRHLPVQIREINSRIACLTCKHLKFGTYAYNLKSKCVTEILTTVDEKGYFLVKDDSGYFFSSPKLVHEDYLVPIVAILSSGGKVESHLLPLYGRTSDAFLTLWKTSKKIKRAYIQANLMQNHEGVYWEVAANPTGKINVLPPRVGDENKLLS